MRGAQPTRSLRTARGAASPQPAAAAPRRAALEGGPPLLRQPRDLESWTPGLLLQQSLVMGSASAVLGPLCDGLHSAHGALRYARPLLLDLPPAAPLLRLETTWWTPLLFALAGVILGVSHPLLDAALPGGERPRGGRDPPWPGVLAGIGGFVLAYYASAVLDAPLAEAGPALDLLLWAAAAGMVLLRNRAGLLMAALTAVGGPAIEVALIHAGLYQYSHPDLLGVPTWIAPVYAAGAPAVGNLGRKVAAALQTSL